VNSAIGCIANKILARSRNLIRPRLHHLQTKLSSTLHEQSQTPAPRQMEGTALQCLSGLPMSDAAAFSGASFDSPPDTRPVRPYVPRAPASTDDSSPPPMLHESVGVLVRKFYALATSKHPADAAQPPPPPLRKRPASPSGAAEALGDDAKRARIAMDE
jgi:hypothetical protein